MIMVDFLSIFFFAFIIISVTKGLLGEYGKTGVKMNDFSEILDKDVFNIGFHSKEELENFLISLFAEIQDAYSVKDINRLKFEKDVSIQEVLSNCPNCGGKIEVHGASVCQFCNCVLDNTNRNFVLEEMIKMD